MSGIPGPRQVGLDAFYSLMTNPNCIRFAFVRSPYGRLTSLWADKIAPFPSSHASGTVRTMRSYARAVAMSDWTPTSPSRFRNLCELPRLPRVGVSRRMAIGSPMSRILPRSVDFQFIGKVESLRWRTWRSCRGCSAETCHERFGLNASGRHRAAASFDA